MQADQLRRLAWRATPLWEREPLTTDQAAVEPAKASARARRWREVVGGAEILRSRLRGRSPSDQTFRLLLGGVHRESALPSWAVTLDAVLRQALLPVAASRSKGYYRDRAFDQRVPLPFQEILAEFVRFARQELTARAGAALRVLCRPAIVALERQLLSHLSFIASLTIGRDFYRYRFDRVPASAFETMWRQQPRSSRVYRAYVRHMRTRGLADLCVAHPVLARLVCQSVEQWICAGAELCSRCQADFVALRSAFAPGIASPVGAIARVQTDLSDRHRGGRVVLVCQLSSGEHVVYKPRSVQPENVFHRFIDWLNEQNPSLQLKSLRVVECATHGWMEAVEAKPCSSQAGVRRFYRRAGMLLCALHVFATTDVHCENLLASGEHPVVVDLETMLNEVHHGRPGPVRAGSDEEVRSPSVMNTGMLPYWPPTTSSENEADMSALGNDDTQAPTMPVVRWEAINTDQMMMSRESILPAAREMTHRVEFRGTRPNACEHLSSLLGGFREVYDCLLENRERLLSAKSWLNTLDGLTLRILVRSTLTYTRLQLHSLHPQFLEDGVDRSIELEWLARPLSPRADQDGPRRLYECERAALEQLDVPHLTTDDWKGAGDTFADEEMRTLFKDRDSHVMVRRLQSLCEDDCRSQLAIIEKSVRSRFQC